MTLREDWSAIAARIDALVDASRFLLDAFGGVDLDAHQSVRRFIMPEARGLSLELANFHRVHNGQLPAALVRFLEGFLERADGIVADAAGPMDLQPIVAWKLFRAQFEYGLRDSEELIVSLTERAFAHLQRLIAADPAIRRSWRAAFAKGERACEALGGAHLLHHGIYAFKVRASGAAKGAAEETDLVYQERPKDLRALDRISDGFVLTEWKVVRTDAAVAAATRKAVQQLHLYASGALGGAKLARTRYVVLVTEDFHAKEELGQSGFRRIVLRVKPSPPSKSRTTPRNGGRRKSS